MNRTLNILNSIFGGTFRDLSYQYNIQLLNTIGELFYRKTQEYSENKKLSNLILLRNLINTIPDRIFPDFAFHVKYFLTSISQWWLYSMFKWSWQAKFAYGGSIWSSSQYVLLPQLSQNSMPVTENSQKWLKIDHLSTLI